jgi:hypothetical protein
MASADLSGVTSGVINFPATGGDTVNVVVQTVNRAGVQGSRNIIITLSDPVNCTLNSAATVATCPVSDRP